MTAQYTLVGDSYACNGRKTRDEAITEAKAHFIHVRDQAQRNLEAISSGTVRVAVQTGWLRPTKIEELP